MERAAHEVKVRLYYLMFSIILIIYAIIISASLISNSGYAQSNQTLIYQNATEGIKYQYPSHWGNISLEGGCISKFCEETIRPYDAADFDNPRFSFAISKFFDITSGKSPNCGCETLTDFVKWYYSQAQNVFRNFIFINDSQTTIGKKYPASQFEFSGSMNELSNLTNGTRLVMATKVNSSFYSMVFYPVTGEVVPTIRKLVDSMEFFTPNVTQTNNPSFYEHK